MMKRFSFLQTIILMIPLAYAGLVDRVESPGEKSVVWDGRDKLGRAVGSGVYFYKLQNKNFTQTKKMIVIK